MKHPVFTLVLTLILCITCLPARASAPDSSGSPGVQESGDSSAPAGNSSSPSALLGQPDDVVTTQDIDSWVGRKGNDIITILVHVVQVLAVIGFFIGLIMTITGALSSRRSAAAGLVSALISCAVFAAASMGPELVSMVSSWLRS